MVWGVGLMSYHHHTAHHYPVGPGMAPAYGMGPSPHVDRRCFGGFWQRLFALFVDLLLILLFLLIFSLIEGRVYNLVIQRTILDAGGETLASIGRMFTVVRTLVMIFLPLLYFTVLEAWLRGTFGKRLFGLVVVKENCQRVGIFRSVVRNLAKSVSCLLFCVGFLMVMFTGRRQGLHDFLAGSYVMKNRFCRQAARQ